MVSGDRIVLVMPSRFRARCWVAWRVLSGQRRRDRRQWERAMAEVPARIEAMRPKWDRSAYPSDRYDASSVIGEP